MLLPECLTVVPEAAQVALGGQLAVSLTLQNTSDREACYHLDVSGIPVDWYDLDQPRIALLPAASVQVLLTVHPRRGTVAAAGRYALTVQVTAEDDPAHQAAAVVALTVRTGSGVDLDVQPTDVVGRAATFRLTYHNHAPAPVAIALLAHASEEGLRFRPEPAEPVVVPGDCAGSVVVHVVPKVRERVGVPHAYTLVFRALPLWPVPQSTVELVREARFTYVPYVRLPALAGVPVWVRRLPVWSGALALVLLVLLLVLAGDRTLATATRTAGMRTPAQGRTRGLSRPSIRRFTLVHRRQGQPYELVWQTSDAPNVTLDGRPVSTHGDMVLPAPLHSATYQLVATNGARRATAHLHVVVDALTTDRHAVVLALPDIATFAVRRRHGQRYAIWRVRHAVSVQLQGRPVGSAGERRILPGASTLRLVASNDVGSRQSLLPLAPAMPTATAAARPTRTPTTVPLTIGTIASGLAPPLGAVTALPIPRPTVTPTPMSVTVGSTPPGSVTTPPATTMTTTSTASPVSPAVLLNPAAVDFGRQGVSTTSAVHVVYVVNVGEAPLTVTTVAITGPDPGDFAERDSCTYANIGVTGGCTIRVRFTPLTTGTRSATLVIVDTASGSPQNVPLTGQG